MTDDPIGMCWDRAQLWYSNAMRRQRCAVHRPALENAALPFWLPRFS